MTSLSIIATGPITSVQDFGRVGTQRYGLPPSGAMDRLALASGNALVGNPVDGPAIEIGPFPARLRMTDGRAVMALTGAARSLQIGDRAVDPYETFFVNDGETISIGAARGSVFSYLAVGGGFPADPVFGSFSVTANAAIGSPIARPLQAGDVLELRTIDGAENPHRLPAEAPQDIIRVVTGPQADSFGDSLQLFFDSEWQVTPASSRMGYRLDGPAIHDDHGHNVVSDGTVNGSVQIPGDGRPIVLMPDRGTTGGYPKIATVITADLGALAQMQAGRRFRFSLVSVEAAEEIARTFLRRIEHLPRMLKPAGERDITLGALLDANVAGTAVSALDSASWHSPNDQTKPDTQA